MIPDPEQLSYSDNKKILDLRTLYSFTKIIKTIMFIPAFMFSIISVIINDWYTLSGALIFLAIVESVIRARKEDLDDEEKFIRRKFDEYYGQGEYDKINIHQ